MGNGSPVREDWLTKKSRAEIKRPSAGTISPAEREIRSPGTSPAMGSSVISPSRTTLALVMIFCLSSSAAFSALYSWRKSRVTLAIMMIKIIIAEVSSPAKTEMKAATRRMMTSRF